MQHQALGFRRTWIGPKRALSEGESSSAREHDDFAKIQVMHVPLGATVWPVVLPHSRNLGCAHAEQRFGGVDVWLVATKGLGAHRPIRRLWGSR